MSLKAAPQSKAGNSIRDTYVCTVHALSRTPNHPPASKSFLGRLFLLPLETRHDHEKELLYVAEDMQWRVFPIQTGPYCRDVSHGLDRRSVLRCC